MIGDDPLRKGGQMRVTTSSGQAPQGHRGAALSPVLTAAAALVVVLTLALTACSSNSPTVTTTSTPTPSSAAEDSTASSYPAGKEEVCQARDGLTASMAALTDPALLTGGADGIKSALGQVQTSLTALAAAGKADYAPQIDALQSSLAEVQTALGDVGSGNVSTNLVAVGTAIGSAGSAASDLFSQLTTACGS